MTQPPAKPCRMAPLQKLAVKPIEDPAARAALDEQLKRLEEAVSTISEPQTGSQGATAEALNPLSLIPRSIQEPEVVPPAPPARKRRR